MAMKRGLRCEICGDAKKPTRKFDVGGFNTALCSSCVSLVDFSRNPVLWRAKLLLTLRGIADYLYGGEQ